MATRADVAKYRLKCPHIPSFLKMENDRMTATDNSKKDFKTSEI